MLDFSGISKGYLLERSGSLRRRVRPRKIKLSDICWVYVEKVDPNRSYLDLEALYRYTMRVYLRDGSVVMEDIDSRKTNVEARYRTLKGAVPWAAFGYHQKFALAWKNSRQRFVSDVDERRANAAYGEYQGPKRRPGQVARGRSRDCYQVLGVPRTATVVELNDRFRLLALKYHPDRNKSPDAEVRFKEVSEAYATALEMVGARGTDARAGSTRTKQ